MTEEDRWLENAKRQDAEMTLIEGEFLAELKRRNRKLSDTGDVPTPPEGKEGLPIPASQDPLRRLY